jgi:hypothetical protein
LAIKEMLGGVAQKIADKLGRNGDAPVKPSEQDGNANPSGELTANQQKYGPNFEHLKEQNPRIANALQTLCLEYRVEGQYAQRHRILRTKYARLFWQNIHYALPNSRTGDYDDYATPGHGPESSSFGGADPAGQRFQRSIGIYQAYGLTFVQLMSQDIPSWICYPKSRESQEDITAAKVGYDVGDLIERNNNPYDALQTIGRYLWTDGVCYAYTRYVVDGDRFGFKEMPIQGTRDTMLNGQRMTVPEDSGTEKIPNGQEVISYMGGLEVIGPIYPDEFADYPYLQWNCEPHKAKLKAMFPHAAKGIEGSYGMSAEQLYERVARLGVKQNLGFLTMSDVFEFLPTFSRTWLRKWAFKKLEDDDLVAELEELFPDGAYVAFAGLEYCEARNETMNDHWKVVHAIPGDGQARPAAGDTLIDINEQYDSLSNMREETYEYGIPPIYADPQVLDFDALRTQTAEPAVHYPARARPGMALQDGFYSPDPAKEPVSLGTTMQELIGPVAQFLTGLFNAAGGGPMEGVAGKTAAGYEIARDQSLGRIGMIIRRVAEFYADNIALGLEVFKKNRPEDVEVPFPGEHDEEKAKWIRLADFRGNVMVECEADASYPRLKSQQREVILALLEQAGSIPGLLQLFDNPASISFMKSILGVTELQDSNEDARLKALRSIQKCLQSGPFQPGPKPVPQMDPQTGQVAVTMQPQPPQSTVQVHPILDRPDVILETCIDWANSDAGQDEAQKNPLGVQNVALLADQAQKIVAQRAQQAQQKIPPKPPSMSVQIDKLPPGPMAEALAQDNIHADPNELQANKDQQREDKANELKAKLAAKPSGQGGFGEGNANA